MQSLILFGQTNKLISFSGQTRPQLFVWLRQEFHDYIQVLSDINLIWGGIITLNRGLSRFNQLRLRNTWNEQLSTHTAGTQSQRSLCFSGSLLETRNISEPNSESSLESARQKAFDRGVAVLSHKGQRWARSKVPQKKLNVLLKGSQF